MKVNIWYTRGHRQKIGKIEFDRRDFWSLDCTLAPVIMKALQGFKEAGKTGIPYTDPEDAPERFRDVYVDPDDGYVYGADHHLLRWEWILDEMIRGFAFVSDDVETAVYEGRLIITKDEDGLPTLLESSSNINPVDTKEIIIDDNNRWLRPAAGFDGKTVRQAFVEYSNRCQRGRELFGKYFMNLWD